jgi:lipopolysaccharide biosynthesis regulator YciM
MKTKTKNKLLEAWQYCDKNEKSTEFMLQYMQDVADVDLECVLTFIEKITDEQGQQISKTKAD